MAVCCPPSRWLPSRQWLADCPNPAPDGMWCGSGRLAPMEPPLLVVCLCAAWCTTCDVYAAIFRDAAALRPEVRFAWIDVEDDSDALGEAALDIESFPTLQIQREGQVLFHGTVLPQPGVLTSLLDAERAGALAPGAAASVPAAMAAAVWGLAPMRSLGIGLPAPR